MADDDHVPRADFERALRHLNLADLDVRELVLKLAAQVVALTEEVKKRLPPTEDPAAADLAFEQEVNAAVNDIRAADDGGSRVALDTGDDKYAVEPVDIPCGELISLCHGRCCQLRFALSTQDLDEGVIRFDYGKPYMIRQRASDGYCVHNEPTTLACTAHAYRPRVCRTYDCRDDKRIWIDFDQRIATPLEGPPRIPDEVPLDLHERARMRGLAIWREQHAIDDTFHDSTSHKKRQ